MQPHENLCTGRILGLATLLALGMVPLCFGQFETASVLGTVSDANGGVIQRARVSLQNADTGTAQEVFTNGEGRYQFLEVRVGRYRVVSEATGFKRLETPVFHVDVGARQRVDVELHVGDVTEIVQVEDTAAVVEADSSDRGQVVNREAVLNLPLNGRSSAALALLAPGVRQGFGISKRESTFNMGGMRSQFNNFILDGVDNNAYGTSNQGLSNQVVQVSPDALQEFKIITNSYSAEYGHVGGGVVNASVRAGTNELHGSLWEYLRNTDLNAVGYFKPTANQKPVYIQNQFGAAAGGPIKKDKIFLFGDYEGLRNLQRALSFGSVPTLAQRAGNLGIPVLNPYTGETYSNGVIPASQITAFGSKVFGDLPAPNLAGNTSNYSALLPSTDGSDKGDLRYDHYLTGKITAFSRFSYRLENQLAAPNNKLPGPSGQGAGIISRIMNWQTATDKALTGGLNTQNVTGYASYGRDYTSPQWQNPFVYNPKINYSKILGRHTLKLGYEYQAIITNIDDFNPAYGQDIYGGQFSNPTPSKSNTVYNLADFLLGARSTYQLTNFTNSNFEQRMHFAYLQDDYKVSPRLTLNAGLRYEFATPQYERDNRMANYAPATNSLVYAKNGSIASRALVDPNYKNFGPRLGLAYSLNSKTVIRGGYAVSYVLFMRQGGDSYLAYNGPYVVNAQITQSPSEGLCTPNAPPTSCFRPTQMGYPDGFTSPANFSTVTTKTVYIQKDIRTPYAQNWHFTIQRALAKNLLLDLGYAGNHGVGLWVNADLNQALPNQAGQALPLKARRPDAQFDYIDANYSAGFSTYHALQAKLEKKYFNGLFLLNSFTWSKAIDNAAGALEAANGDFQAINMFDRKSQKGLSGYDQPFNNTSSVVWNVPVGHNRRLGGHMPSPVDALLGVCRSEKLPV